MPPEITVIVFFAVTLLIYGLGRVGVANYEHLQETLFRSRRHARTTRPSLGQVLHGKNRLIVAVVLAIVGGFVGLNLHLGALGVIGGAVILGGFPLWWFARKERARRLKIESQVVPTLNMLANSMRAGKTLSQAIDDASRTAPKPMANELSLISRQIMVGIQPAVALDDFQRRIKMPDIKLSVRAMLVSITTGADLPEAIERINQTINARNKVQGKIRTLTTQGKMQGIILGLAPFVLLIAFYLLSPSYMKVMFDTIQGNIVLGVICFLQIIAFVMIQKIVTVKV